MQPREGGTDIDHDVSMLIRLGEAGRRATVPSNVSMTIMRPPQHGACDAYKIGRIDSPGSCEQATLFEPGCAGEDEQLTHP